MEKDEIIEAIRELILEWKGVEASMFADEAWIYGSVDAVVPTEELTMLRQCITDLQALYAKLVD